MKEFHPMCTMLYTVNLDLCDYVPFSQIRSQLINELQLNKFTDLNILFDSRNNGVQITGLDPLYTHFNTGKSNISILY